jgi:hypothetical protein
MPDPQHLLEQFIAEDRAGELPDPAVFLELAAVEQRTELVELLDTYLAHAPRRSAPPDGDRHAPADRVVHGLRRALDGANGAWPAILPQLRHRAGIRRTELVARLTADLGVVDPSGKVGAYYHAMELGTLPADGVSDRVLEALGAIIGTTTTALREAARAFGPREPVYIDPADALFARIAEPDPAYPAVTSDAPRDLQGDPEQRDDIDRLFTGEP